MPVSSQQLEYAKGIIPSLELGAEATYTRMKRIKPKGLRGSMLKHISWPTSWAVLYDLSPAQISQNREPEKAREAWEGLAPEQLSRTRIWQLLLRGYFTNHPEPMSESNFPNWRKPSWMSEGDAQEIRNEIRRAYEATSTEEVTDAELAQPMPTEDVPREQRMADLAQREEEAMEVTVPQQSDDGEGSEPFEDDSEREGNRRLEFDSLHALYSAYWRRTYGIENSSDLRSRFEEIPVRKGAIAIYTLEKLGYRHTGIKNFLQAMSNRGLMVYGVRRGTRSGYNAYALVDLKGNTPTAGRYQSSTAYRIMAEASRDVTSFFKGQFEPSTGRKLQVMRFTGRGGGLGGYQILSLNSLDGQRYATTYAEGNRMIGQAREEAQEQVMQLRDVQGQPGNPVENLEPPAPTVEGAVTRYYYVGYQRFQPGMTFRSSEVLHYQVSNMGATESPNSYAFYFTSPQDAVYKLYRAVFNPIAITVASLPQLKEKWNDSGQLNTPNTIKLQEVRDLLNRRKLRQMIVSATEPPFYSEQTMQPKRSDAPKVSVPFDLIFSVNDIQPAFTQNLQRLAQQEPTPPPLAEAVNRVLSEDYMKRMGQSGMVAKNPFGIEIEGWFAEKAKSDVTDLMKRDGIKVKSTRYHGSAPSGYFKLEDDSSVKADGQSYDSRAFEMVSPVLEGETGKKRLLEVLGQLRKYGAKTTASAGTHIHFPFSALGDGDAGLQGRKQLITNVLVLAPFLKATQVLYSQDRYYARDWTNVNAQNLRELQNQTSWSDVTSFVRRKFDAGRNFLHIKESSSYMGSSSGPPTYEFRFPASNFEDDSVYQLVRLLDRIWTVSKDGYVPHSPEMCQPRNAEKWLTDLLGVELYSFWRNRIRDVYPSHRYLKSRRDSEYDYFSGDTSGANWVREIHDEEIVPTAPRTPVPPLNDW
jgi:hypothetical protein